MLPLILEVILRSGASSTTWVSGTRRRSATRIHAIMSTKRSQKRTRPPVKEERKTTKTDQKRCGGEEEGETGNEEGHGTGIERQKQTENLKNNGSTRTNYYWRKNS